MRDEKIITVLLERFYKEHEINDRKGVYAMTQKMMAYNSNRIEGSTLTSEQTASLFDTGLLVGEENEVYKAKDIEEMNGHFLMFNHMLHTIDLPLTEAIIKELHYNLKAGVFEDRANGYPVGEYKNRRNIVSDITTTNPADVEKDMEALLGWYHNDPRRTVEKQMELHARFEKIHPFQDGNGRVGRMLLFRECLRDKIVPVIIQDENKPIYYRALHKAQVEGDYTALYKYGQKQQQFYKDAIMPFLEPELSLQVKPVANIPKGPKL